MAQRLMGLLLISLALLSTAAQGADWESRVLVLQTRDSYESEWKETDKYYCVECKNCQYVTPDHIASSTSHFHRLRPYSNNITKPKKCVKRKNNHIDGKDCVANSEFEPLRSENTVFHCAGFD